MATVEITSVRSTLAAVVELSKVGAFATAPAAVVQIADIRAVGSAAPPARVEIVTIGAFTRDAVDGSMLLVEYTEQGWQRVTGSLVRWSGAAWTPA